MNVLIIILSIFFSLPKFLNTSCLINITHLQQHFKQANNIQIVLLQNKFKIADWLIRELTISGKVIKVQQKFFFNTHKTEFEHINLTCIKNLKTDSTNGHLFIVKNEEILHKFLEYEPGIVPNPRDFYTVVFLENATTRIEALFWTLFQVSNLLTLSCTSSSTISLKKFGTYKLKISMNPRQPTAILQYPKLYRENFIYRDLVPLRDFAGIDGCLLKTLTTHLNLSFEFINNTDSNKFGRVFPNGTTTGTLALITTHQADIGTNGRFIMNYGNKFEFTVPYSSDQICAIVPKSSKVPKIIMLAQSLKFSTWFIIFLLYIICTLIWNLLGNSSTGWWTIYAIFHGFPVRVVPTHKIFLISCMLFSIIVTSLIQGSFFKTFTTSTYYKDITTLKELDESGLPIAETFFSFASDKSKIMTNLKRKKQVINRDVLEQVAYKRNIAKLERKRDIKVRLKTEFLDENGESLLHLVDECFTTFFIGLVVPKNSVYLPGFNDVIGRVFESGLTVKWYQDVEFSIYLERIFKIESRTREIVLTLSNISSAFCLLFIGLFIALLIFIWEILTIIKLP